MMYDISVIIPSFKPDNYIHDCLYSLKNQTFKKYGYEIIIILNGPKEPYYTWLCAYIKTEMLGNHVTIIYNDTAGVSHARNIGIDQSKGRFIAFIDDDDVVSENYLQGLHNIAINNTLPLSYARSFISNIYENKKYYITNTYEKLYGKKVNILNSRSLFSISYCKLIDRDIIADRRFDIHFQNGEDALFMFLISDRIGKMQFATQNVIYYRRIRKNSLSTSKRHRKDKLYTCIMLIIAYMRIYLKNPLKYNFLFLFTRLMAIIRNFILM
ncbi:MAG: glycosyltransferase family 2 protein [Treponema sp.]|nr:glycosyltransferase family 2 protein [Treponema sp.]